MVGIGSTLYIGTFNMQTLTLTLNTEQVETIYNALLEDATRQDMRADDLAEEIENVDCSYWIGQLVEAKLKQRNANNVRSYIREAIRESDEFNWCMLTHQIK